MARFEIVPFLATLLFPRFSHNKPPSTLVQPRPVRLDHENIHDALLLLLLLFMLSIALPVRGQITLQPSTSASGTGAAVRIGPGSSTDNLLDIFCDAAMTDLCFSFGQGGVFTFEGNTAQYGTPSQSTASHIDLYGGIGNPGGAGAEAYIKEYSAGTSSPTAPTLTVITTGGFITAGTYYFRITYITSFNGSMGETLVSGEQSKTITGNSNKIKVTSPSSATNAIGYQIYESSTSNNEQLIEPPAPSGTVCTFAGTTFNGRNFCQIGSDATWTSNSQFTGVAGMPTQNTTGGFASGYWFISGTTVGVPCFSSAVPGVDCTTGNSGTVLMKNPMTATGDIVYGSEDLDSPLGDAPAKRLPGNITNNTRKFLSEKPTGTNPQAPTWSSIDLAGGATEGITGTLPVANGGEIARNSVES